MEQSHPPPPTSFISTMSEFLTDLETTFPEYTTHIASIRAQSDVDLYRYCRTIYPMHSMRIMLSDDTMFCETTPPINTQFLPHISFTDLWKTDISDATRECIWTYLQALDRIILCDPAYTGTSPFTQSDGNGLGELPDSMKETLEHVNEFMSHLDDDDSGENDEDESDDATKSHPLTDDIIQYIQDMMHGKLGTLATRLVEEIFQDMDLTSIDSMSELFKKLTSDETMAKELMDKVTVAMEREMKAGTITESEIMEELSEFVKKLKQMPDMKGFLKKALRMVKKMMGEEGGSNTVLSDAMKWITSFLNGGGGESAPDTGDVKRKISHTKVKERLRARHAAKQKANLERIIQEHNTNAVTPEAEPTPVMTTEELVALFATTPPPIEPPSKKKKRKK